MMPKIIIVENNQLLARMYARLFRFEGYETLIAASEREALEELKNQKPKLIMIDILMPLINGDKILDKLSSDPSLKKIPVIILFDFDSQEYVEDNLSMRATKCIDKTIYEPRQIIELLKNIFQNND